MGENVSQMFKRTLTQILQPVSPATWHWSSFAYLHFRFLFPKELWHIFNDQYFKEQGDDI